MTPYPPQKGGIETQVEAVVSRLKEGHEIHLVTYEKLGREESGVEIYEIPVGDTFFMRGTQFVLGALKKLKNLKGKVDLIHAHPIHPAGSAASLSKVFDDTPLIMTSHGSDLLNFSRRYPSGLFRKVGNQADGLICVSEFLRKRARDIGITAQIRVIGNGVDPSLLEGIEEKKMERTAVFAGSLEPYKRPAKVLGLAQEFPDYRFVVIGDGSLRNTLKTSAESLRLENVDFLGSLPRKETLSWIKSSDCLLVPSEYEGFGLSALEAMTMNTPVIASDVPALNELLSDRSLWNDLAEGFRRLKEKEFRKKMVKKNREKSKKFEMDRKVKKLEEFYREVVSG